MYLLNWEWNVTSVPLRKSKSAIHTASLIPPLVLTHWFSINRCSSHYITNKQNAAGIDTVACLRHDSKLSPLPCLCVCVCVWFALGGGVEAFTFLLPWKCLLALSSGNPPNHGNGSRVVFLHARCFLLLPGSCVTEQGKKHFLFFPGFSPRVLYYFPLVNIHTHTHVLVMFCAHGKRKVGTLWWKKVG